MRARLRYQSLEALCWLPECRRAAANSADWYVRLRLASERAPRLLKPRILVSSHIHHFFSHAKYITPNGKVLRIKLLASNVRPLVKRR